MVSTDCHAISFNTKANNILSQKHLQMPKAGKGGPARYLPRASEDT